MSIQVPIPLDVETTVKACIGAAITVHRELGPGFREVIYRRAYCLELDSRGLRFECENRYWSNIGSGQSQGSGWILS